MKFSSTYLMYSGNRSALKYIYFLMQSYVHLSCRTAAYGVVGMAMITPHLNLHSIASMLSLTS